MCLNFSLTNLVNIIVVHKVGRRKNEYLRKKILHQKEFSRLKSHFGVAKWRIAISTGTWRQKTLLEYADCHFKKSLNQSSSKPALG